MDYPYAHSRRGLRLTFDSYSIDETEAGSPANDRLVELTGWTKWSTVTVTGTLTIEDGLFEDVFPPDELDEAETPARLLLARDCRHVHDRGPIVELADADGGVSEGKAYEWECTFHRDDIYAQASMTPVLVRDRDGDGVPGEHAWVAGQQVATGTPAIVVTDDVEEWLDGNMPVKLKPFSKSGLPGENLFSLDDTYADDPVLWINSELELVSNLLVSRVPAGPKAQLRDALASQLAHPVWVQLVFWTATDVDADGNWNHDWQEAVLEHVVTPMWDLDTATEAATRLHQYVTDEYDSDGTLRELAGDVNGHLQRSLSSGENLTNVVANNESN